MNINYYTLCWGDRYLKSLLDTSLKSFFSKKPKNFEKFNHSFFIYTNSQKSILKEKIKKFFIKKKIKINFINYSKEINLVNKKKISVWKNLGKFQLSSIEHSYKDNAKCVFIFPDEIHSDNLLFTILKNYKKNLILMPSNEINKNKIKFKLSNLIKKNNGKLSKYAMYSFVNKSSLDFVNYAFVDQNYFNNHNSRYYLIYKDILYFKNIHLSTIFLNPKIFLRKNSFFQEFYTLDMTLSNKDLNKKIIYPDEALIFSLEENEENNLQKFKVKNKYLLFLCRLIFQTTFSFNNKDGIDPFNYLRTYKIKIKTKIKDNSNWFKKLIFFDLFSYISFILSFIIFILYYILKSAFYFPKKTRKISERLHTKEKWIKSK